jgi:signal peptidase II
LSRGRATLDARLRGHDVFFYITQQVRSMKLSAHVKTAFKLGSFVMLADQLSKWWLVNFLMRPPHDEYMVPVTSFLNIVLVHNKGVTFGLLNNLNPEIMPTLLTGAALMILFFLGRWLWLTNSDMVAIGLGAVMGGAIGNLLDRIREGAVIDFLDFYYGTHHWYAFNVADAAIVTGVGLLVLDSIIRAR